MRTELGFQAALVAQTLADGSELTGKEISARIAKAGSSIAHSSLYFILSRLGKSGYVSVRKDPKDLRFRIYSLTGDGRRALKRYADKAAGQLSSLRSILES